MLSFDRTRSSFVLDGARVGPGSVPGDLAGLSGELRDMAGQPGWAQFGTRGLPVNLTLSFKNGRAHSGYFWADVPGDGGWDAAEAIEETRRAEHEAVMRRLFGASSYADARIDVRLQRDPRAYLEMIFFELKEG